MKNDLDFFKKVHQSLKRKLYRPFVSGFFKIHSSFLQGYYRIKGRIFYKKSEYYQQKHTDYTALKRDYGAYGEYLLSCALKKIRGKWLFNVYLEGKEGSTEIDALFFTEKGIFVFEVKNYKGKIYGSLHQKEWTHLIFSKKGTRKYRFFNPLMQNSAHLHAVQRVCQNGEIPLYASVVYLPFAKWVLDEKNEGVHGLRSVSSWIQGKESVLSKEQIHTLYRQFLPYTRVSEKEKEEHRLSVEHTVYH